jgi:hypothetical protein
MVGIAMLGKELPSVLLLIKTIAMKRIPSFRPWWRVSMWTMTSIRLGKGEGETYLGPVARIFVVVNLPRNDNLGLLAVYVMTVCLFAVVAIYDPVIRSLLSISLLGILVADGVNKFGKLAQGVI